MTDAATGKVVGTLAYECFVVDAERGLFHCPSDTLDLTGRGRIVFTESVYIGKKDVPPSWPWPIIRGTGEFRRRDGDRQQSGGQLGGLRRFRDHLQIDRLRDEGPRRI
jgi:hypothetical protein